MSEQDIKAENEKKLDDFIADATGRNKDAAERRAEELLPCYTPNVCGLSDDCCTNCWNRPNVVTALRALQIEKQSAEAERDYFQNELETARSQLVEARDEVERIEIV